MLHKSWSNHKYLVYRLITFVRVSPLAAKKKKILHFILYFTQHNNKIIYFFTPTSMCNCQNNNHPTPQPGQSLGQSFHKTHYQSQPKSTQDPNQYPHNPFLPRSRFSPIELVQPRQAPLQALRRSRFSIKLEILTP